MARVKYSIDRNGMRELGRSAGVQGAALDAARTVASVAGDLAGDDAFEARPATVTAGWDNESRAGAEAVETEPRAGAPTRALARAAQLAKGVR